MLGERYDGIVCSDRWRRLRLPRPRPAVSSAGRTCSATSPPTAKGWANNKTSDPPASPSPHDLFEAWQQFQQDGDRAPLQARIAPLQTKLHTELEHASRKSPRPSTTASSPATSSNAGPPSGPSPTPTASSRPTTTPNAASAAPSSTASSPLAANPNAANAASNDSSPPRSPADSADNRSSPTSPRSSPPTPAATQYPPSADAPTGLNAYRTRAALSVWKTDYDLAGVDSDVEV